MNDIDRDTDAREALEAKRAIERAKLGAIRTERSVASIHQTGGEIRSIVNRNGYVDRFRAVLRGA